MAVCVRVCGCVYGPLGVFIIFPVLSTLGCDGYRGGVSAWLQAFLMYVMGEAVRCELMAFCQRSCDAAIRVVIGLVMTFKKDNFLGL